MKFKYITIKFLFYSLVFLISTEFSFSQSGIILKDYDINSYPKVKSEIYIFDKTQLSPVQSYQTSNLAVFDNGIVPLNVNLVNQGQTPKENLSVNLILDLGLDQFEPASKSRFEIGKDLCKELITIIDSTKCETALTSFDQINYLSQNFTRIKSKLINSLNLLFPSNSSNLDEAFLNKPAGSLEIHKLAQFDNNTILITDGAGLVAKSKIINDLIASNIKVLIVLIDKPIGLDLKELSTLTGGFYIDKVDENSDIKLIAKYLYSLMLDFKPSIVEYENDFSCNDFHDVEINIPGKGYQTKFTFNVESFEKPILVANPKALAFSSVVPGTTKDLDLTLTAANSDIIVSKFSIPDPRFTIITGDISNELIIPANTSHKLTIRFTPSDSAITFTTLDIVSTACMGNEVYITGGFPNTPPVDRTIKLLTPTCNQTLIPGDTVSIIWTGLLPQDVIQLEYSTNNGKTWDTLARNITNLSYLWTVPNQISNTCLIRAIQLWPNNVGRTLDLNHQAEVNSAFFNNDGSLVLTASSDNSAGIWNGNSGQILHWLQGHKDEVIYAVFNPEGNHAASVGLDSNLIIWDVSSGNEIKRQKIPYAPSSVNYSPDGSKLIVATASSYAYMYDTTSLENISTIPAYTKFTSDQNRCWYAEFSPDGSKILTAGNDGIAKVWDWENDISEPIEEYNVQENNYGNATHATYNTNASKIAVSSLNAKKIFIFNSSLGNKLTTIADTLYSISHGDEIVINSSKFNLDPKYGERLLSAAVNNVQLWDANTGLPANPHIIQEHTESIRTACFNFDAKRILTASWDFTAKIWNLEQRDLQMDTTDCTFRIKNLELEMADIEFPPIPVYDSKDSTINEFITNNTDFNFEIRNLYLSGNSNGDFQIIKSDKTPFYLDTLTPSAITVLFRPTVPGLITDTIHILTGGGIFSAVLSGIGLDRGLISLSNLIDFGKIEIGDSKDTVITMLVKNISFENIDITGNSIIKPDTLHFSLVDDMNNSTLKPDETMGITLRYTPSDVEINNGTLKIDHTGPLSPLKVGLLGEGVEPSIDSLTLVVGDISGEPGEIISVPIYIKNLTENGLRYSVTGFATNLRFNSSLLIPLDFYPSYFDGNDRIMQINLPTTFSTDSLLATLKFKVALGNDSLSQLKLEYTSPIGLGKVFIKEKSGLFTLTGFCTEGTPRLFDASGRVYLNQSVPNPAINMVDIEISLIETDYTKLYIVDVSGKIVKTVFDKIMQKGKHDLHIDISNLPAGIYNYILETPTRKFSQNLIIQR